MKAEKIKADKLAEQQEARRQKNQELRKKKNAKRMQVADI